MNTSIVGSCANLPTNQPTQSVPSPQQQPGQPDRLAACPLPPARPTSIFSPISSCSLAAPATSGRGGGEKAAEFELKMLSKDECFTAAVRACEVAREGESDTNTGFLNLASCYLAAGGCTK
jgi:hypothetical protein